jgi:hypothetical protein
MPNAGTPASNSVGSSLRRVVGVDAGRAAGEDDRRGLAGDDLLGRDVGGDDLGVDAGLADPPRDELGVLRAEVDDEDGGNSISRPASPRPGRR